MAMDSQRGNKKEKGILVALFYLLFIFMNGVFYLYEHWKKEGTFTYNQLYVFAVGCLIIMFAGLLYCARLAFKIES